MRAWMRWFILVFGMALLAALAPLTMGASTGTTIGKKAPDFTLKNLAGKKVTLSAEVKAHRVTLVNFWATWCQPCRREIPHLVSFYGKNKAKGVQLLAVDLQETADIAEQMVEQMKMTFPVLLDLKGRVAEQYLVRFIPTTFILDRQGIIRGIISGGTSEGDLQDKIAPLLQ